MISTAIQLGEAIRMHRTKCEAEMAGLTSLASERVKEVLCKGPMVEVALMVEDVSRVSSDLCKLAGRLLPDHGKGHLVYALIRGTAEEARLFALRPCDTVCVTGYATHGPPSPHGLGQNLYEPFVLSDARDIRVSATAHRNR